MLILSQQRIRDIYNNGYRPDQSRINTKTPQFGWSDLIGDKITSVRNVALHPRRKIITVPGEQVDVMDLESGRTLIIGEEGFYDSSIHHAYLVDQRGGVKYSSEFVSPDRHS